MNHLAMFAKYWQAGRVKTRLADSIGVDVARDVYLIFLRHLLTKFETSGDLRTVVFSPPESAIQFRRAISRRWQLQPQSGGDLGCRMRTFFADNLNSEKSRIVLIGSDTPDLPVDLVERAFDLLDGQQVVVGPSLDGGYYLIGIRESAPDIFAGIPWSTDQVFCETISRLDRENIAYSLLPNLNDVDELPDLQALLARLKCGDRNPLEDDLLTKLNQLELSDV